MPVPVLVRAELVPSPALDQAEEVGDQARESDWARRLVRHRSVQLLVARIPPEKIEYSQSWLEPKLKIRRLESYDVAGRHRKLAP